MRKKLIGGRQIRPGAGVSGWFPAQLGLKSRRVDLQQHEAVFSRVEGIRNANDLMLCRAMDEPLRFQAGRAVLAGFLRSKPLSMGSQVQDQGNTS